MSIEGYYRLFSSIERQDDTIIEYPVSEGNPIHVLLAVNIIPSFSINAASLSELD